MKKSAIRPREDQVAELTRGQKLPLDPIANIHLDIIFETLSRVWDQLKFEKNQILAHGSETEINAIMESRLNNLCTIDPFWSQLVTSVVRGKESLSYDGSHLEKRPDLSIFLTGKHPSFPIVVECKIIDSTSGKGVDLYCKNGISRFVVGEYAWANREAVLIAYTRDSSTIDEHLTQILESGTQRKPDPWQTHRLPARPTTFRSAVSSSHHSRNFIYSKSISVTPPGAIALWHLWLNSK
ncbi:hypothetical protein J3P85_01235 [Pseudomonas sp. Z1-12]|uniref:hypothetical protein n=1 Tax=Pseudomonas sp. Z1-12 TaxID=2817408 RepID=UPI003DA8043C